MRSLLKLLLAVALLVGIGVALLWWAMPRHRIGQEGADQITLGMTKDEVAHILRVPSGDYTTLALEEMDRIGIMLRKCIAVKNHVMKPDTNVEEWLTDRECIIIVFEEDKVIHKQYFSLRGRRTFLDQLRKLVRL